MSKAKNIIKALATRKAIKYIVGLVAIALAGAGLNINDEQVAQISGLISAILAAF